MNSEQIYGFFGFQQIYDQSLPYINDGDNILEIGAFLGKSTSYMAKRLKEHKKNVKFYVVDLWERETCSSSSQVRDQFQQTDLFPIFKRNMEECGVFDSIIPIKGKSRDVLSSLEHIKFKFIFIDGSHLYDDVYYDISTCKNMLTEDGILAGDDYQHPDVKRAVDELLPTCKIVYGAGNIMYRV